MKKLQNNFTTPEQSKRLLELGVPAASADCVYEPKQVGIKMIISSTPDIIPNTMRIAWNVKRIPCWSVGRLIEIYEICFGGYFNSRYFGHTLMEDVLLKIEEQIDSIDFSKLED